MTSKCPDVSLFDARSPVPDSIYAAGKSPKDVIGSLSGICVTIVGTDYQIERPAPNITKRELDHKALWSYDRSPSMNLYYCTEMFNSFSGRAAPQYGAHQNA